MKLSPAQRKMLEAIANGDVVYMPYGGYYRRTDQRGGCRIDTMTALISRGLAHRPAAKMGVYQAIPVEATDAGKAALGV